MIVLASWLEFFWKIVRPEGGSSADSGTFGIWVIIISLLTALVSAVCKAYEDEIKRAIKWLLGTWRRALFTAGWVVFVAMAAYLGSWIMLFSAIVIAPIIAIVRLGFRLPFVGAIGISLIAMAVAWNCEWYYSHVQQETQKVYFVLSFENSNTVSTDSADIELSWQHCKRTLSQIFSGLSSVKIHINPDSSDYKKYLWEEIKTGKNFDLILDRRGREPDVVVKATISMYATGQAKAVKSLPELDCLVKRRELNKVSADVAWRYDDLIPHEDEPFLSFAISAWVWQWVKSHQPNVQPTDSERVNRNMLTSYREFLLERKVVDSSLVTKVDAALKNPTDESVTSVLNEYYQKLRKLVNSSDIAKREEHKRELALSQIGQ